MLNIVRKHKMPVLILSVVVIYALQFLVFPKFLSQYYPVSNEAWFHIYYPFNRFFCLNEYTN